MLPSAAPLLPPPSPPRGSRPSGSPSTGPGPRLTCLGLWLGQLLLCGRDGFCSFARHFCIDKGEKKPHRTCGRPEKYPEGRLQTPVTGLTQWYRVPGAQTSTGTEGRPAAASAGKDSADPAGSRRSGSHAAPRLGAAAAYAAQPPPPGPATASAASARRAEPSPRGRPGILPSSEPPRPHRRPRPLRRRPPALPPGPAALPTPRGRGWRRMAAATLTVREAEPKMAAERDQAAEGATSGKRTTSGGKEQRTSARPPRPAGCARAFRAAFGRSGTREREPFPGMGIVPRSAAPLCPPGAPSPLPRSPGTRTRG